jgi:hypothetical protein
MFISHSMTIDHYNVISRSFSRYNDEIDYGQVDVSSFTSKRKEFGLKSAALVEPDLVGRERELEVLQHCPQQATEGKGTTGERKK